MARQRALSAARLHLNTVARLRPRQVFWRLRYAIRRPRFGRSVPPAPTTVPDFDPACLVRLRALMTRWAELAPPEPSRLEAVRHGRFTFAGASLQSEGMPPWHGEGMSRLWRYEVQYCTFMRDLALAHIASPDEADRDRVLAWMRDWVASNPPCEGPAWEAYPTAARLINWALAEAVFRFDDSRLRASFARQAGHLSRHIEWHIDGNHLLQNAVGLVVAGALLGNRLEGRGVVILREAVAEQVLPDGGHAERCPMYHMRVMADLLVAAAASESCPFLEAALPRMAGFLRGILHEDGDLPQFGDTALGEYPPPQALTALAGLTETSAAPTVSFLDSGFHVMTNPRQSARLIVKASPAGMACQPGHAHNDALSYEFDYQGARVVVDSGLHGYEGSALRDYCRSTAAHNTVQVGGIEQARFWKTFRMAQRYAVEPCGVEVASEALVFTGAIRVGKSYRQERRITLPRAAGAERYSVGDRITGRIAGQTMRSYIHLHPAWRASRDGEDVVARGGEASLRFMAKGEGLAWELRRGTLPPVWQPQWRGAGRERALSGSLDEGWYCPGFGEAEPCDVLVLTGRASAGATEFRFGYAVRADGGDL